MGRGKGEKETAEKKPHSVTKRNKERKKREAYTKETEAQWASGQ